MNDLIRREEAIDQLHQSINLLEAEERIKELPTAEQWIPCSERLPSEPFGCLLTVWDTVVCTGEEFENILPYFGGWDGEQWNDDDGDKIPFEVIAWMELPKPFKGDE